MRVFAKHSSPKSIGVGAIRAPREDDDTPALPIVLEFQLRDGSTVCVPVFGMLDTGASMTIIPGHRLGLSKPIGSTDDSLHLAEQADESTLAGRMDFEAVSLSGVLGSGRVPGYKAFVNIGGRRLGQQITVGAVVEQWEPLIGRDVINEFIIALDPWRRTSALANGWSGGLSSLVRSLTRGRLLKP